MTDDTMTEPTIESLAREAGSWFEGFQRDGDEETHRKLKDARPDWVYELVQDAHGDFFPDDWRYAAIERACDWIADNDGDKDPHEFADTSVDVYTGSRLAWLASSLNRPAYCDEAASELGWDPDQGIVNLVGLGQYHELNEVYGLVYRALEERAGELETDEG